MLPDPPPGFDDAMAARRAAWLEAVCPGPDRLDRIELAEAHATPYGPGPDVSPGPGPAVTTRRRHRRRTRHPKCGHLFGSPDCVAQCRTRPWAAGS